MSMTRTVRPAFARLLTAGVALLLFAAVAAPAHGRVGPPTVSEHRGQALGQLARGIGAELAQVRAATARYHDVDAAIAAGYEPASPCVEDADGAGAMGYHYVAGHLIGELDPTRPQALLYHPTPNGRLRLVGVEYLSPTGGELFGQPFGDAIPQFGPDTALHVWLWQANPAGMFAAYNPNLSCS
jgi:hypothetical protein